MNDENKDATPIVNNPPAGEGTTPIPERVEPSASVLPDISARLGGHEVAREAVATEEPKAVEPAAFDLTKLSAEQLQQFKAMLNATPDRISAKKGNMKIMLRRLQGRFVVDFKPTKLALVYDPVRLSEVEALVMPVRFQGDAADKFTDVLYKDFMLGDQVVCEVLSTRDEKERRVEGEVVQKESGRLVDMEVWTLKRFFTVRLPDNSTIELEAKISNA